MIQKLFVIYDVKSETYTAPRVEPSRETGLRNFADGINDAQGGVLFAHPEDFTLFEIGTYDLRTGDIVIHEAKVAVANGMDVKLSSLDNSVAAA